VGARAEIAIAIGMYRYVERHEFSLNARTSSNDSRERRDMVDGSELRPWKTLSKETVLEMGKFLTVENHTVEWPGGRVISDWAWLIAPDAAIILAVTPEQKFLCFRQTKYAFEGSSLAPPGGMVDDGEDPLEAAKRELLEETGFAAPDWSSLGSYKADPNRGIGTRHFYLAKGAHRVAEPDSDDVEDQHLLFLSRAELMEALVTGEFKVMSWMAVVALALHHLDGETKSLK
jgi:ADP-ribose pyrophosphatase